MRRDRAVAALGYGLFVVVLGLPDGALGVLWPSMRHSLHRPIADLGVLALVGALFYVGTSAVTGWLIARFGVARIVVVAAAAATVAFTGWSVSPVWSAVLVLAALLGASRGWIDSSVNAHAAHVGSIGGLGVLHAMYGVGATLGPLFVTGVVAAGAGWRTALGVVAVAAGALMIAAIRLRDSWAPMPTDGDPGSGPAIPAPSSRVVLPVTLFVFFCYTAVEGATGAWAFVLLTEGRGLGRIAAGIAVATYWAALTGGRFLLGWLGRRAGSARILRGSWIVAVAGLLALWAGPDVLAPLGLPVAGLGFAAIFPVLVALTPSRVGQARAPKAIGLSIAAAALGGPSLTALAGGFASAYGVRTIAAVLVVAGSVLAGSEMLLARVAPVRST